MDQAAKQPTSFSFDRSSSWACRFPARTCSRPTSRVCPRGTRFGPASAATSGARRKSIFSAPCGRKQEVDFLVPMNAETPKEDVLTLDPGAAVVYAEPLKLNALRNDLVFYPVPFDKLVTPVCPDAKLRRLVRNMIYDGVLAKILGIDMALMEQALTRQLGKKAKAVTLNAA